jgi:tRNA pseudouridine13 synthase
MSSTGLDLSLPYITEDLLGIGGMIRAKPEDFLVEEVPLFEPSGEGDHLYVNITKMGATTREVQEDIAGLFDIRYQDVGTAGLKDKDAIATQTFSVYLEENKLDTEYAAALIEDHIGFRVNWTKYHNTKIRSGHLIGNKFKILISDIKMQKRQIKERVDAITERIHMHGIPNYYGDQRLGRRGKNVIAGWKILNGEKRIGNKWLSRYLVSAYQSYICNRYLSERVNDGMFEKLVYGDVVSMHNNDAKFWVTDLRVDEELFQHNELSFTVPMYGPDMMPAEGEAAILEERIFKESGLNMGQLRKHRVRGARRLGRLVPIIEVEQNNRGIQLTFTLGRGGFATTVLREYQKHPKGVN